mmetsp:Transcript_98219/g.227763  ORF Transcript_98219/g.227763 Transcript_98219/m.227763 type:complete len:200 (+) Transcript_98219:1208-1807(+)
MSFEGRVSAAAFAPVAFSGSSNFSSLACWCSVGASVSLVTYVLPPFPTSLDAASMSLAVDAVMILVHCPSAQVVSASVCSVHSPAHTAHSTLTGCAFPPSSDPRSAICKEGGINHAAASMLEGPSSSTNSTTVAGVVPSDPLFPDVVGKSFAAAVVSSSSSSGDAARFLASGSSAHATEGCHCASLLPSASLPSFGKGS